MRQGSEAAKGTPRISPEEYVRLLGGLELKEVRLVRCEASCDPDIAEEAFSQNAPVGVDVSETAAFSHQDGKVVIQHDYSIRSRHKRRSLFKLTARFNVVFAAAEFTPEFFEAFKQVSLRSLTWPYIHELTASIIGRMELPTLNLGFWRVPRI